MSSHDDTCQDSKPGEMIDLSDEATRRPTESSTLMSHPRLNAQEHNRERVPIPGPSPLDSTGSQHGHDQKPGPSLNVKAFLDPAASLSPAPSQVKRSLPLESDAASEEFGMGSQIERVFKGQRRAESLAKRPRTESPSRKRVDPHTLDWAPKEHLPKTGVVESAQAPAAIDLTQSKFDRTVT